MNQPLQMLVDGMDLGADAAGKLVKELLKPGNDPSWKGAILGAWACKGETAGELVGAAKVILAKGIPLDCEGDVLDTCGTGGDGLKTFNISTATAILAGACGVRVVKHGNRGVSSTSGSADVLALLGINLDAGPIHQRDCLDKAGVTFCLAPRHYPLMAALLPLRKALGTRTIFNALGPLLNPARARRQLLGVGRADWLRPVAEAAMILGNERTVCVHGSDGMDEVTLSGSSTLIIAENGRLRKQTVNPDTFGLPFVPTSALTVAGPDASAARIRGILGGKEDPGGEVVAANTAVALWTAGAAADFREAAAKAKAVLKSGKALGTLECWAMASKG